MMQRLIQLMLLLQPLVVSAFTTQRAYYNHNARAAAALVQPSRSSSCSNHLVTVVLHMGGGRGGATSLEGKMVTVQTVQTLLDTSEMIFTVPASSLTVAQAQTLRASLPSGTTAKVVKNKLMARAVNGTEYAAATGLLKGANMWFFIQQDIGATVKAYNAFIKTVGKLETHAILGGTLEGQVYDAKGVQAIGNLPSKQELYARIAGSIQAVPTKVARVIKAPNSKLARAIKLATDEVVNK
jgi:large subunit ribosomal protein L10